MLAEHDVGLGEALKEPVIDHGLCARCRLLRRLKDRHERLFPRIARLGKYRGRAYEPRHMHVVTAGVHHRRDLSVAIGGRYLTGIGQTRGFLNRKRVHVRAA